MLGTIPQQQHQQRQVLQCIQRQLDVEKGLHELACQELVLVQEKQEHVTQYGAKDVQEVCRSCPAWLLPWAALMLLTCILLSNRTPDASTTNMLLLLQRAQDIQRELCLARMESEQLKLDGLRQRKQNSILRLKLASAKEDTELLQRNMALLDQHSQRLMDELAGLRSSLATAQQQLTDVSAARAMLQADAEKHQVGGFDLLCWCTCCCQR